MRISARLLAPGLLLASLYACTPDAEENPQPDLIAGGGTRTWQMTDAQQDGRSSPLKSCLVGDLYTFKADESFVFDEGAQKCSSTAPQTVGGRWEVYNSILTLRQTGNQPFIVLKIRSLTASRMVAQLDNNGGPVIEYTFAAR